MEHRHQGVVTSKSVRVPVGNVWLDGDLASPLEPQGAGAVRPRQRQQPSQSAKSTRRAGAASKDGFATLLIDLLTEAEEAVDRRTAHLRFDIELLSRRLVAIVDWLRTRHDTTLAAHRSVRREHRRRRRAGRGGCAASRSRRRRLSRRTPRPGVVGAPARDRADAAHRRQPRCRRDRDESRGDGADARRGRARDRAGSHALVRGAGHARTRGRLGDTLVRAISAK